MGTFGWNAALWSGFYRESPKQKQCPTMKPREVAVRLCHLRRIRNSPPTSKTAAGWGGAVGVDFGLSRFGYVSVPDRKERRGREHG